MGYRSDVRIITSKKGFDELKRYTDKILTEKNWKYGNLLDDCMMIHENKYSKYFGWNSIKWYDHIEGFEDVSAIMDGLSYLEEQDLEYPSFLREFDDDYTIENMMEYDDYDNQDEMEV